MQGNQQNNQPAPKYYKYLFFGTAILGLFILIFVTFGSIFKGCSIDKEPEETTMEEVEYVEIKDIDKYNASIIYGKEAYFLFEEITVNDSKLKDKLGETNSEFYKNKKNKYKAIDCAVFRLDEGLEVFNLNNSDNIVVKNDLGLGHSIFVKNFDEYKGKYDFQNRTIGECTLYLDIRNGFDEKISFDINQIKNLKKIDKGTETNKHVSTLLTVTDENYCYSYNVKYLAETNHIVVYDYINNMIFEGNLNLEVTNENN